MHAREDVGGQHHQRLRGLEVQERMHALRTRGHCDGGGGRGLTLDGAGDAPGA